MYPAVDPVFIWNVDRVANMVHTIGGYQVLLFLFLNLFQKDVIFSSHSHPAILKSTRNMAQVPWLLALPLQQPECLPLVELLGGFQMAMGCWSNGEKH